MHGTVYRSADVNSRCDLYTLAYTPHIWFGLVGRKIEQCGKLTGSSRHWRIKIGLSFQPLCPQQLDSSNINMGKLTKHHQ